jgi:glycosyltransferase involved in cell wall biosynthesis
VTGAPLIGIDASRLAVAERTGTETYTHEIVDALGRLLPAGRLRLYLNTKTPPPGLPATAEPVAIPFPRFWTHARISWEMQRRPPDVLFVPAHVVPIRHPRTVVTVHDLGYLHIPDAHPPRQRRMLDLTTQWSVRAATRVIAISARTRDDLVTHYGADPAKIAIVHHGVSAEMRRPSDTDIIEIRRRYRLPERFVLAVGTLQPRKNLGRLSTAVRALADDGRNVSLVLAGKPGWLADRVEADLAASGLGNRIHRPGYVPDADLPALYAAADVVAFPSLYEGFGLPALEAMACGAPVLAAAAGALPEVCGDAALLADPYDIAALARGIATLLDLEPGARDAWRARGIAHAAGFTWDATGRATLDALEHAARAGTFR